MDRNIINRYFHTLKYLKFVQIYYRLLYLIRNKVYKKKYSDINIKSTSQIIWKNTLYYPKSYLENNTFQFLNQKVKFELINWNFSNNGKLWNYNLLYFDFLNQKKVDTDECLYLIQNFIENDNTHIAGHEPYPLSLRNVNWIKFLSLKKIKNGVIDRYLYGSYLRLIDNLEFHLLGNHLLENAFSLLFGAYYFDNKEFYNRSEKILMKELDVQILGDGGHFELSPMYHSIILHRVLDSLYLINNNGLLASKDFKQKLEDKAVLMLSWLQAIKYQDNSIPNFNDSTNNIAFHASDLFEYAKSMDLDWPEAKLNESGYRKFSNSHIECIMDFGIIGPDYLPGHGHSDIFNFELHYKSIPFIVDTGTSTYQNNEQRYLERSTQSHNTVVVNNANQSEVWHAFRVGKRAKIIDFTEQENTISASHNGYKDLNITHNRSFTFKENTITIKDKVHGSKIDNIKSFLHFHPYREIKVLDNKIVIDNQIELKFTNYSNIKIKDYKYCLGYNQKIVGKKMVGLIQPDSKIEIIYKG